MTPYQVSDQDVLEDFGYHQELRRDMSRWTNFALGFAFVSPVVGMYTIFLPATRVAGPRWWWALVVALAGQGLVALVFAELAAQFPLAGGVYQWSRRLVGPRYAWFGGWAYIWALITIFGATAFAAGTFLGRLIGISPSNGLATSGLALVVLFGCTLLNVFGGRLLAVIVKLGIGATLLASLGIGVLLLLFFRQHDPSIVMTSRGGSGGYDWTAFMGAVAFAGWAFIGFDACGSVAEETRDSHRVVPVMIISSLASVGLVVLVSALALILAAPNDALRAGGMSDPIMATLTASFGPIIKLPLLVVVVIAYIACCLAIQATVSRVLYSLSRDEMLPGSFYLKGVSEASNMPVRAIICTGVIAGVFTVSASGLDILVLFSTSGLYGAFALVVGAALFARSTGRWRPAPPFTLGRVGLVVNVVAFGWLLFETVNLGWPRQDSPFWYERYAAPLVGALLFGVGSAYFLASRPDRRWSVPAESSPVDEQTRGF